MALLNLGWEPKTPKAPGLVDDDRQLRQLIVDAVNAGKLTKTDAEAANRLIGGRPLAVWAKLARDFADQAAITSNVRASELLDLLSRGPAAALFKLASDRKAAQEAFEQTAYSAKLRDLKANRAEAFAAFAAVEHDEDVTPEKKRRLLRESEAAIVPLNAHLNSRDPELAAYRREAAKTADPTLNELKWENFAI